MAWYNETDKLARRADAGKTWHGSETKMQDDATGEDWDAAGGTNFEIVKEPFYLKHPVTGEFYQVPNFNAILRSDTRTVFASGADRYVPHQNAELRQFVEDNLLVHPNFRFHNVGSIKGGATIWYQAVYKDDNGESPAVLGSPTEYYALATTSHDKTGATRVGACVTDAVCRNTIRMAATEDSMLVIKHSARFDADKALARMTELVAQFEQYNSMAESLAAIKLGKEKVCEFLGELVGVKADTKADDISTRKLGILDDMLNSLSITLGEPGKDGYTAWTALNTVTRYVDHARGARRTIEGETAGEARFASSMFGSGQAMKAKALDMLVAA